MPCFQVRQIITHMNIRCASLLCLLQVIGIANLLAQAPTIDRIETSRGELSICPIRHATFALMWGGRTILVDPVGETNQYAGLSTPALILITDIHSDHLNVRTLEQLTLPQTRLVVPPAVAAELPATLLPQAVVLTNGQSTNIDEVLIQAVPMYNTSPDRVRYHPKGRGNGYVLTVAEKRIYISGDTEDIPEMLALKDIDVAFICMNLPYTMSVEQAVRAVSVFRPKVVYPYHYRGSDLEQFKSLLRTNAGVEVRIRDWYR